MSSTSQSMTATPSASTTRRTGQIIALSSAVLAIVSFFLPWVSLVDNIRVLASLTGIQVASGALLASSDGGILFRGSPVSYIVPFTGVVVLLGVFFAFRRRHVNKWDAFVTFLLGVVTLFVVWGQLEGARRLADKGGVLVQLQFGMILVWLALIGLIVAGVMNVRIVTERDPSLKGTLGAWGFMGPAGLLVMVFFFIPVIILLILSQTDLSSSNFGQPWTFIGLGNYARMFSDSFFPKILGNTFRYVILTLGLFNVGLALVLAILTTQIRRRVGFFFRVIWLLPRLTPSVIYILMWKRIAANPPFGILNQLLTPFGVDARQWLFESPWLFVIMVNGFVGASFGMILFSSAIESIPKDYITAAKVDGASTWQILRDITLPLIRWPLLFVTVYQTLSLLTSFEYILLLTDGGPGLYKTEVWALTAYHRALQTYFGNNQWGYGASWGFVLVIIGIVLSFIYLRVFRFNELVQEPKIDVL